MTIIRFRTHVLPFACAECRRTYNSFGNRGHVTCRSCGQRGPHNASWRQRRHWKRSHRATCR